MTFSKIDRHAAGWTSYRGGRYPVDAERIAWNRLRHVPGHRLICRAVLHPQIQKSRPIRLTAKSNRRDIVTPSDTVTESDLRMRVWQKHMCLARALTMAVMSIGFSTLADDAPTILAVGDSITQGSKRFVCYRQILVPALLKKGVAFEFIGPNKDATSAHAGYGGKNTKYLNRISKEIYRRYPADIVLIHSGHNSFSRDKPVPGIVRDTEAIIDNIRAINPGATILLAQVIPAGKLPKYSYIPELNRALESLAVRLAKRGCDITLVNCADGFDWQTDTIADKVHPNRSGAEKMAAKWLQALLPLLVVKEADNPVKPTPGRP